MPDFGISLDLATRVDRLERQARRLRQICVLTTVALVGVTAIGAAAVSGAITSKSITVVDASGHARVKLDAQGLHIFDTSGRQRVAAGLNALGEPEFSLADAAGVRRFRGYISPNNNANLRFTDGKANDRFWVDASSMSFYDVSGTERVAVGVTTSDQPLIKFFDGSHSDRGFMGEYSDSNFGAFLKNASGTTTWSAP
ncbi:MAG TPA: hypothetical protein VGR69_08015 [Candidatus Rubrimentiphilum sp.]|nr:hypothetical protein [Candidatus Rubrimentiphilum sp.]